jgi:hypothetical protein
VIARCHTVTLREGDALGLSKDDIQVITTRVPKDVHEALRTLAFATDSKINDIVVRAIRDYLSDAGHRKAVEALAGKAMKQYRVALDKLADL